MEENVVHFPASERGSTAGKKRGLSDWRVSRAEKVREEENTQIGSIEKREKEDWGVQVFQSRKGRKTTANRELSCPPKGEKEG